MVSVRKGDNVKVEYEGRFDSGEIFDSSSHGDHSHPLEFEVGAGQVIVGFDDAVLGMEESEEKEITLEPEEAYGERREELQQKVPISVLPKDQEPKVGMTLVVGTPQGQQMPVRITAVDKENVTLDLNHPLAGKKLIFKLKVVKINENGSK